MEIKLKSEYSPIVNDGLQTPAPLVDQALAASNSTTTSDGASPQETEFNTRLSAMKHEVERLAQSVSLLTEGTKDLALQAPSVAQEKLRQNIRAAPVTSLIYAIAGAFLATK
ncbi:hypothetical protein [Phyllobacterium sp. 22552]|uniref:hypothetical protein n=1 Tax=Phyllobacterium sp. 22552 TaxID=3453941 RepID=UPI003F8570F9